MQPLLLRWKSDSGTPIWLQNMTNSCIFLDKKLRKFNAFVLERVNYYLKLPKSVVFICGLIVVHAWVEYALVAILITHLTDDWLHLPKAASIINVQDGITAFLVLVVAYASDALLGPFRAVVCTTIAYIFGLLLLFFAAWRLQSVQIQLLYVALILIGLGRAGRDFPLKEFIVDQCWAEGSCVDEEQAESRRKACWRPAYNLGIGASIYVFTNASWIKLSKISAIAMGAAFALFIGGTAFYERKKPAKSTLKQALQVLYAAIRKRHLKHTSDDDHIKDIPLLRWLDKAAIEEPSPSVEEQKRKGRLFGVEEIQKLKILLTMIPLWTTFLVYGLLQATGSTFFYEQVNYMDTHLGKISNIPIIVFVIIKSSTNFIVSRLCDSVLFPSIWGEEIPRHIMLIRIGVGMAISPICCIVAWRVEDYRVQKYVNDDISISFLWLIPQFFLLGLMEGLVFNGMEEIFYAVVPESFSKYGESFTQFSLSIGNFLSLAFILIFHGLFNDDLDTSSLGVYYGILAYVCFVNLLFYCYVATYYVKQESYGDQEIEQQLEQLQSFEDNLGENQQHFE